MCHHTNFVVIGQMVAEIWHFNLASVTCIQGKQIGSYLTMLQSNLLKWTAMGIDYEYPLGQSIHLSMFYILHCV